MRKVLAIAKRIWSQFAHDPRTLVLLFVAPLLVLWLLSVLLVSDTYRPSIAVVDLPEAFQHVLGQKDATIYSVDADEAADMLAEGTVDAVVSMEPGSTTLHVLNEGTSSTRNAAVARVVSEAVSDFGVESRTELEEYVSDKKAEIEAHKQEIEAERDEVVLQMEDMRAVAAAIGIDLSSLEIGDFDVDFSLNTDELMPVQSIETDYYHGSSDWDMFDFLGPVFIALFLFVFIFLTCSFSLVNERAAGTMERFLDTPVRPVQVLAGYSIGFGAMSLLQAAIILSFGLGVIGFPSEGSIYLVVLVGISLALASVTMGLLVSGLAHTSFQIVQLMLMFVVPQILLCGLFDLSASPGWLQVISVCLPLTHGVNAMTEVMLAGGGFADIWLDLAVVWGFVAGFFALASLRFMKKRAKRERRNSRGFVEG